MHLDFTVVKVHYKQPSMTSSGSAIEIRRRDQVEIEALKLAYYAQGKVITVLDTASKTVSTYVETPKQIAKHLIRLDALNKSESDTNNVLTLK